MCRTNPVCRREKASEFEGEINVEQMYIHVHSMHVHVRMYMWNVITQNKHVMCVRHEGCLKSPVIQAHWAH